VQGQTDPEAVGEDFNVEEVDDGPRPFTALLDTGLKRTSTGSRVFAALKVGATIPITETNRMHLVLFGTQNRTLHQRWATDAVQVAGRCRVSKP
jgi:Ribosomal large subunit proteins 60S L5, and 50S L18